jgi:hypothetical protein
MKYKGLTISAVVFFLIVNTSYLWQPKIGILAVPFFLLMIGAYFILAGLLIAQLLFTTRERFSNRPRLLTIVLLTTVLTLTLLKPAGLINFEKLEGKDLLVAQREGAANCMTTFRLKENNKFTERSVCFGTTEVKGNFKQIGDTLFFSNVSMGRGESNYYEFALIRPSDSRSGNMLGNLVQYKSKNDSTGNEIWIVKNELPNPNE